MKRGSSLRFIECPMPPTSGLVLGCMACLLAQPLGRVLDCLDDVHVARAATEISGDGFPDLRFTRRLVLGEERAAGHHHSRSAVPALQAVLLPEALLDRVELPVLLQTLDRADLPP